MDWMRSRMRGGGGGYAYAPPSGNRAFDEYRMETLRRLEEEQSEFREFLDRLRMAKDKSEFDQFMAERRNRPPEPQGPVKDPVMRPVRRRTRRRRTSARRSLPSRFFPSRSKREPDRPPFPEGGRSFCGGCPSW